jgi:hypothetical protein
MRMSHENGIVNVLMYNTATFIHTKKIYIKLPFEEFSHLGRKKAQMVLLQTSSSASAAGSS